MSLSKLGLKKLKKLKLVNSSISISIARFDFSWGDVKYHQETLANLKLAVKATKKLYATMLDTVGPELQVINKSEGPISLEADAFVVLTPNTDQEATSDLLPINFDGLAKAVKQGDTIFVGQYLFTGSETTSVWLEVSEVKGDDIICLIKNSATLVGSLFTLHAAQIHIDLPTLTPKDKEVISTWGVQNNIDFISLSFTRHAEDVRQAREFLSKCGDLSQTQILAKIENVEGLTHFDEILEEADGIILSRGNLGIDLPPEKVTLNTVVGVGDAKEAICEAVEKFNINLLVMGSHGKGAIKRFFLGSVSNYCVHHAKCPVLVVKKPA